MATGAGGCTTAGSGATVVAVDTAMAGRVGMAFVSTATAALAAVLVAVLVALVMPVVATPLATGVSKRDEVCGAGRGVAAISTRGGGRSGTGGASSAERGKAIIIPSYACSNSNAR